MNRAELIEYIQNKYTCTAEYLWNKYPNYVVFRHQSNSKWFAIIMDVPSSKLSNDSNDNKEILDIVDVKVAPENIGSLRLQEGFYPAYHMNKEHWVSVLLSKKVSKNEIKLLIDDSYHLTK
ncbi:MmcQ/YjbR family DNA-binding protein [Proteus myxofaciens]|uniref:Uncharacterized DUF419 family protein n=1 Tax=Proteus myxofaciens ATCC 19692 TaxID=1354337 RepID=A0A198FB51_9GAMM|nr:MmcQ/YjbR family DNA-binding protein [Proteus myxofaciens]OAT21619.1 uncharacterized DUF419 family protein [Proteus myxofaciens ATCC 19692]